MTLKRIFDFAVSLVGLLLLGPVLLVIALMIKLRMPGPVFFSQYRIGRDAQPFKMVKFRTMQEVHDGSSVTVKGQSRITPLGAVLRKYKLDELPELWNVLKGDMSLVGPRPDVPGYADKLTGSDRLVLSIRPGITCMASLKYSNEEEMLALQDDPTQYNQAVIFPDKVRMNLQYIQNRSFWIDLKIIVWTVAGKKRRWEEEKIRNETGD